MPRRRRRPPRERRRSRLDLVDGHGRFSLACCAITYSLSLILAEGAWTVSIRKTVIRTSRYRFDSGCRHRLSSFEPLESSNRTTCALPRMAYYPPESPPPLRPLPHRCEASDCPLCQIEELNLDSTPSLSSSDSDSDSSASSVGCSCDGPTRIESDQFYDTLIIGAGPNALGMAARLREPNAAALYSDADHARMPWLRKAQMKRQSLKGKRSLPRPAPLLVKRPLPTLKVIDAGGKWMGQWNNFFSGLGIAHLRSPLLFHPSPSDNDALRSYSTGKEAELKPIDNVVGRERTKHAKKSSVLLLLALHR